MPTPRQISVLISSTYELWLQQFYLSNPSPQFLCIAKRSHIHARTHTHTVFYAWLDREALRQEAGRNKQFQTERRLAGTVLPRLLQSGAAVHAQSGGA